MDSDPVLFRIHRAARAALWLVLLVLAAAAIYTVAIALTNWTFIGV